MGYSYNTDPVIALNVLEVHIFENCNELLWKLLALQIKFWPHINFDPSTLCVTSSVALMKLLKETNNSR